MHIYNIYISIPNSIGTKELSSVGFYLPSSMFRKLTPVF